MPAMARAVENSQLRRMMMQALLCAALGVTIALAWWVGRIHAAALAVKLDEPHRFADQTLSLDVRLPVGWKSEMGYESGGPALVVTEPKPAYGVQRILTILVRYVNASASVEKVASKLAGNRPLGGSPSRLKILGTQGVLVEYPLERSGSSPGGEGILLPELIGCAIVPDDRPTVVCVKLTGLLSVAPADIDLLRSVAESLARSDPKHPLTPVSKSLEEPEELQGPVPAPNRQESPTDSDSHGR